MRSHMTTDKPNNSLTIINNTRVAEQLLYLAEQVKSGAIKNYEFKQTANSVTFTIDSADGRNRVIEHQHVHPGLMRSTSEYIQKQTAKERRKVVKELNLEGFNQQEIARRTLRSQKTISDDIKKLKADGEL